MPQLLKQPALRFLNLNGVEHLSKLYEYTLELRTPDDLVVPLHASANLDLKSLIGHDMTVSIQLDGKGTGVAGGIGAGIREISGLVTSAAFLRRESSYNVYQVILRPWLWLATLTTDFKIFQNMTVIDILERVLGDYPYPVEKRLDTGKYEIQSGNERNEPRNFQVQYGESDYDFCQRLMEEWGIYWFFEHGDGKHRLVLCDHVGAHRTSVSSAYHTLAYHPAGGKIDTEYVEKFKTNEALRPGGYSHNSYDFVRSGADLTALNLQPRKHRLDDAQVYEWPGDHTDGGHGDQISRVRMEALRTKGSRAKGRGDIRGLACGQTFALTGHSHQAANSEYLVIRSRLELEDVGEESGGNRQYRCSNKFLVQPANEVFRPERLTPRPNTHGPQSATVVGPEGNEIWTDEFGRVRVRFHWDRYARNDETDSCWVRVAQAWAGDGRGSQYVPRIGDEVLIDYFNGDPDRPLIIGSLHNGQKSTPWELPGQHALSGFRSRELGGSGRVSKLVLDDTAQQIQAVIASDHQGSQLSLGYLTHLPSRTGRTEKDGEGFALRTDSWGSVRSARGLYLSTWARSAHSGTHMDAKEALDSLREADQQLKAHSDQATAQQADPLATLDANATLTGALAGNATVEFAQPVIAVSSPVGITTTTQGSTHLVSAEHTTLTTGAHLNLSAARSLVATVGDRISLFAQRLGFKLIAMAGDIVIDAQSDSITIRAKKKIRLEADQIEILGGTSTTINGGGSYESLNSGEYSHYTRGAWAAHASSHAMPGPANKPLQPLADIKPALQQMHFAVPTHPENGQPYALHGYTLFKDGAKVDEGITDRFGKVLIEHTSGSGYSVKLDNGAEYDIEIHDSFQSGQTLAAAEQHLSAAGYRGVEGTRSRHVDYPKPPQPGDSSDT